jgi:hypothetical protein
MPLGVRTLSSSTCHAPVASRKRSSPAIPIQTPSPGRTPIIVGSRFSALSSTRCGTTPSATIRRSE